MIRNSKANPPTPISGDFKLTTKVAINGFGRIGRNIVRALVEAGRDDIQLVAINYLGPV